MKNYKCQKIELLVIALPHRDLYTFSLERKVYHVLKKIQSVQFVDDSRYKKL